MAKASRALAELPAQTLAALEKLGADLAAARLLRKESVTKWAQRMHVSKGTLQRLEAGDPTVAVGIVATALLLLGRDGELAKLVTPAPEVSRPYRPTVFGQTREPSRTEGARRADGHVIED
jgi:hypothetical protein